MQQSMFAKYKFEREGIRTIETEWGFATYLMGEEECYIQDIYVIPPARKSGQAIKLADTIAEIAKRNGCKILTGSVDIRSRTATESTKVLLAYGMKISHINDPMIIFCKDLGE